MMNKDSTKFKEIYCFNCKKALGRYNTDYYSDDKINEIIRKNHYWCTYRGHQL